MLGIVITSSLLIGALILMRRLYRDRIPRRLQYALWLLPAIRLLIPASPLENPLNIMNTLGPAAGQIEAWVQETVFSGTQAPEAQTETQGWAQVDPPSDTALSRDNAEDTASTAPVPELPEQESGYVPARSQTSPDTQPSPDEEPSYTTRHHPAPAGHSQEAPSLDSFPARHLLRCIWYAGMAAMALWMAGGSILCLRRLSLNRIYLGREGRVRIYVSENAATPCLTGILRPAIYLTPRCIQVEKHREHTLLHELTHYRHGDHVWIFVRNLCLVIYWFHPLVWLGTYLAARDCELACDEGVLHRLGAEGAQEYGRTLIEMASFFRAPRIPCCGTALSSGKKELKERIARIASGSKRTTILSSFLAVCCVSLPASFTFGGTVEPPAMGRYVESVIEFTGTISAKHFYNIAREGDVIRLISNAGFDMISLDGGATFENVTQKDMPPGTMALYERYPIRPAGSINGARIFRTYNGSIGELESGTFDDLLITETGEEIHLDFLADSQTWYFDNNSPFNQIRYFYDRGSFFIEALTDSASRYYRLDPATGEGKLLTETQCACSCMAADEDLLYLVTENGVLLWGLNGDGTVPQDQALSDFVAEKAAPSSGSKYCPALLYPYENGVYILLHEGLYWHELYSDQTEQIIDGNYCSIGKPGRELTGIVRLDTEAEPEFLILYDNKELFRYTYDASLPAEPEA